MPVKQIVTTLLFYFFFVSVKGQTSRALLVAIDKYPSESGWNEIHATNDIYLLKPLLIKRNFAPAHGLLLSMKAPLPARTKHHHRNGFQLIPQAVIRQEATIFFLHLQ